MVFEKRPLFIVSSRQLRSILLSSIYLWFDMLCYYNNQLVLLLLFSIIPIHTIKIYPISAIGWLVTIFPLIIHYYRVLKFLKWKSMKFGNSNDLFIMHDFLVIYVFSFNHIYSYSQCFNHFHYYFIVIAIIISNRMIIWQLTHYI